jgi:glucose/arabinose dehydrogenase
MAERTMLSRLLLAGVALLALQAACSDDGPTLSRRPADAAGEPSSPTPAFGNPDVLPPAVPAGFSVLPAGLSVTPTSLAFADGGTTLYVASLTGFVFKYPVIGGTLLGPPSVFLSGLSMPLGVLATEDGVFVSVLQASEGRVLRARDTNGDGMADSTVVVLRGLPVGRHNTNGLAVGPDGFIYVANGSSTDSGFRSEGGPADKRPFSGSLLRFAPGATNLTPSAEMVVGTGWRNIYDVAFVPPGHPSLRAGLAVITMNGPDGETYGQPGGGSKTRPAGEDTLSILDVTDGVVESFGFPWCLYSRSDGGVNGFAQDPEEGSCHPLTAAASEGLFGVVQARPATLFGRHVSSDGLAFNPGGNFPAEFSGDLFVAEFGSNPGADFAGHKVVRVRFGPSGDVVGVEDFMSSTLPLDLTFAPDGALWLADLSGVIFRISSL